MSNSSPIRIIGGGMTGLTLALRLAQRGQRVVVHERDPYLGGLSSESALGGVPIERFYHCVLPTDTVLLDLFSEIGIAESIKWNRTRTGFFHDGRLIEMTTTADFLKFPALNVIDRVRLAWTIGYCGLNQSWEKFDDEPVSTFLRRHSGERLFKSIWEPLLLAKLGKEYDRFAASFIWATITRMLSARKYRDRAEKLGFVSGRYGKVFGARRSAIETAGCEVQISTGVTSISRSRGGEFGWTLHTNGASFEAAKVVICTPAPVAAGWLRDSVPDAASMLERIDYLGVVCEVLLLKRSLTPYYVLNLTDRRLPFTGIIEMSNLTGPNEFDGRTLVYLPRYCGQSSKLWNQTDEQLHNDNMRGLKVVIPDFDESKTVAWQMNRARHVQPVHGVGGGKRLPNIHLAPGLAYLSTAQIYPWPVFNNAVVLHVDKSIGSLVQGLGTQVPALYGTNRV
jgi:protoporphyrinogen oxidase